MLEDKFWIPLALALARSGSRLSTCMTSNTDGVDRCIFMVRMAEDACLNELVML